MLILEEITGEPGGLERLRTAGPILLGKNGKKLKIESIGYGPTGRHAVCVMWPDGSGGAEQEIHLEWTGDVWLPFYLRNEPAGTELFLYVLDRERATLKTDVAAGSLLIAQVGIIDLNLWAEGFVDVAAEELRQLPLFREGGAA